MKNNHTQRKWKLSDDDELTISSDRNIAICYIENNTLESYANAKLIAAAPDLLEACINFIGSAVYKHIDFVMLNNQERFYFEKIKLAIKKATE